MERTYEVLNRVIGRNTVEHAKRLRLSTVAVNKWKEPSADFEDSGSLNPLDRIETVIETGLLLNVPTEDAYAPIQYLLRRFPQADSATPSTPESIQDQLATVMASTSEVIQQTCMALADRQITPAERRDITQQAQRAIHQMQQLIVLVERVAGGQL
jgi:hypothetical protein